MQLLAEGAQFPPKFACLSQCLIMLHAVLARRRTVLNTMNDVPFAGAGPPGSHFQPKSIAALNSCVKPLHVTLRSMNVPAAAASSNGFAIRAERVSRHYKMGEALIRAVDEISLEIGSGEFLALLGASGSGKSTLLNLMAGLDRPSSGAILALGRDLATMSSEELATHRNQTIGIVFQSFQ